MKKLVLSIALLSLMAVSGCKPTESNYKAAYDAAQKKRQAADTDVMLPASGLQSVDGPRRQTVGGNSVYVVKEHLKITGDTGIEMQKWNVAVASYKMSTNCASQVDELKSKGYRSFPAESTGGKYYVIAGSFATLEEAAEFVHEYSSGKEPTEFIGMPGAPVIIER